MSTAVDRTQRSPRRLLRAVRARLLAGKRGTAGMDHGDENERVAVVATLLPGSRERAAEILAKGAPYGLALAGFRRHSVFLAEETVVFVFEGRASTALSATSLTTPPARPRSASGHRFSRGLPYLPGRSSTGKRVSTSDALVACLLLPIWRRQPLLRSSGKAANDLAGVLAAV
jgi:hypothetical protein